MTDDQLLSHLEEIRRFIEEPQDDLNSSAKLTIVRMTVMGMIKSMKSEGYDRIPRLVSELACRGVGFPPRTGMN